MIKLHYGKKAVFLILAVSIKGQYHKPISLDHLKRASPKYQIDHVILQIQYIPCYDRQQNRLCLIRFSPLFYLAAMTPYFTSRLSL